MDNFKLFFQDFNNLTHKFLYLIKIINSVQIKIEHIHSLLIIKIF